MRCAKGCASVGSPETAREKFRNIVSSSWDASLPTSGRYVGIPSQDVRACAQLLEKQSCGACWVVVLGEM